MLFYVVPDDPHLDLDGVASDGIEAPSGRSFVLHPVTDDGLQEATRSSDGPVLVVDGRTLREGGAGRGAADDERGRIRRDRIPAPALQNVAPYRPPVLVWAGGGYVTRSLSDDVALLLIHRRGCWDLPKGTVEPGETLRACAGREVCEEVGSSEVSVHESLGTTQHGYVAEASYEVKVTEWYRMQTPEQSFEPERREGIHRVAWARWDVARRHIGYDTLARHMDRVEPGIRAAQTGAGEGETGTPSRS